jgi:dTDP-4-dehydrorhamnose 3,5-epimerase
MQEPLSQKDIDSKYQKKVFIQDYSKKPLIDGVHIVEIKNMTGEDGDFEEVMRFDESGISQSFPGFQIKQVNRSTLLPGAIKAWHLHYNQDDIWHIMPDSRLVVGLLDTRKDSPTKHITMRLTAGAGKSHLIYIPRGVAHAVANLTMKKGEMLYIVNSHFDIESPDEYRLPWNDAGDDFFEMARG